MYKIEDIVNTIICGNTSTELKKFPSESINCVITSPPYWALRDYRTESQIYDGDEKCQHEWITERTPRPNTSGGKGEFSKKQQTVKGSIFTDYHDRATYTNFCSLCGAWRGSLGLEPTFELYLKHLWQIFDEIKRILKPTGTCWVNLGDSYSAESTHASKSGATYYDGISSDYGKNSGRIVRSEYKRFNSKHLPQKCLVQIPSRFSIGMIDRGWILRNEIIWYKRNCMPSSVKDRFTVDFEKIFFFVKSNETQYWVNEKTGEITDKQPKGTQGIEGEDWDWKEIENGWKRPSRDEVFKTPSRMKSTYAKAKRKKVSYWSGRDYWFETQLEVANYDGRKDTIMKGSGKYADGKFMIKPNAHSVHAKGHERWPHQIDGIRGRNKRCVWDITTRAFFGAHFAVFPETLVKPMILSGCPEFICKKCRQAREKIINSSERINTRPSRKVLTAKSGKEIDPNKELHQSDLSKYRQQIRYRELGYTDCGCNAGWDKGIVLDPFAGAGTTGMVAKELGRNYILIDIKPEYCKMAEKRINNIQGSLF